MISKIFKISVFLSMFILPTSQSYASDNFWCVTKRPTSIEVITNSTEIKYDFTKDKSELTSLDIDTISPYSENIKTEIGGLMKGGFNINHIYDYGVRTRNDLNQICLWFDKIKISINLEPTIFIANKYKKGSCKHNEIIIHELEHVKIDQDIAKSYVPIIHRKIEELINSNSFYGPVEQNKLPEIDEYMRSTIKNIIDDFKIEVNKVRKLKQAQIDNLDEYNKIINACK